MAEFVAAIDQGTTSTRAMIFDHAGREVGRHQLEHEQILPRAGWVEHNPVEIWERTVAVLMTVLNTLNLGPTDLAALGITNQRETALVWDRKDGRRSLVLGATADHIVGVPESESREILDELLAWTTQERFSYTHEWQQGDVVIWDNTGMLHRALPYDPSSERLMHRTTIAGNEAWG